MMKKLAAAATVATALASFANTADAKTHVSIGVGIGGPGCYGYGCGYAPGWRPGYGVYDGYDAYDREPVFMNDYLSCRDARWMLIENGWRNVRARDCHGAFYSFTGMRGRGPALIRVNSMTGEVVSVRRLR